MSFLKFEISFIVMNNLIKEEKTELEGWGVKLTRLTEDKIELVRTWRNKPEVQQYMEYRNYITSEMQKQWFPKINNDENFYFILSKDGKDIGLMNIKDIDYTKGEGESGSLIWDMSFRNMHIGTKSKILLTDFAFDYLKLNTLRATILENNVRSIRLNLKFGYIQVAEGKYLLLKENYYKNRTDILNNLE